MPNPYSFPFGPATSPPDAPALGCQADAPYVLTVAADRFPPFVLVRPFGSPTRRLDCARVVRQDTGQVLATLSLNPDQPTRLLSYEKYTDPATHTDYFLYYGARLEGLSLLCGVVARLEIDEFTSAPFAATDDLSQCLLAEWYHPSPLGGVPYGTGLRQRLYVFQGHLQPGPPREERETTKDPVTGRQLIDFLAQTPTATFETDPLPGYLVEALYAAKACAVFSAGPWQGSELTELKVTASGDCSQRVMATLEHPALAVVRTGCQTGGPALEVAPEDYSGRGWRCGDLSDTAPDWQPDYASYECEQSSEPDWQPDFSQSECETV